MRHLALAVLLTSTSPIGAQIVASERASVSQAVDGTQLRVVYGRPRLRGREGLIGRIEPWGRT